MGIMENKMETTITGSIMTTIRNILGQVRGLASRGRLPLQCPGTGGKPDLYRIQLARSQMWGWSSDASGRKWLRRNLEASGGHPVAVSPQGTK